MLILKTAYFDGLFGCFFTNWTHGPLFSVLDTDRVCVITPIAHTHTRPAHPHPPHKPARRDPAAYSPGRSRRLEQKSAE